MLADAGLDENGLYHCQQAAEKSLKAFLAWHDTPFRKTHDLKELGRACTAIDASLTALAAQADVLTEYAWKLRYPGNIYIPETGEIAAMIALAGEVFIAVRMRLSASTASQESNRGDHQ